MTTLNVRWPVRGNIMNRHSVVPENKRPGLIVGPNLEVCSLANVVCEINTTDYDRALQSYIP
jgi:hypothetical protein